jgi:hypothetical protein
LNPATTFNTYQVQGGPLDGQNLTLPVYLMPRPNANFGRMTQITTGVNTSYNGLVIALNRRFVRGLQIQTSYTYSKTTDNGQSSQTFTSANNVLDPLNLGLEQGTSTFDIPHRFNFSTVWMPKSSNVWLDNFVIAPVITVSSGAPFTPLVNGNAPQTTRVQIGVIGAGGINRLPQTERNSYRLPSQASVDLRVSRGFPIGKSKIEGIFEAFNLFNKINYTASNTTLYTIGGTTAAPTLAYNSAAFNAFTNANNGTFTPRPREIQLGVRYTF